MCAQNLLIFFTVTTAVPAIDSETEVVVVVCLIDLDLRADEALGLANALPLLTAIGTTLPQHTPHCMSDLRFGMYAPCSNLAIAPGNPCCLDPLAHTSRRVEALANELFT